MMTSVMITSVWQHDMSLYDSHVIHDIFVVPEAVIIEYSLMYLVPSDVTIW